jgi:hypothetical protein
MLTSLFACSRPTDVSNQESTDNNDSQSTDTPNVNAGPTVVVPQYKDYGRGSVNFTDLVYSRPNIQSVIDAFDAVTETIVKNEKTADDQIKDIRTLEDPLENVETMYTLVEIYQKKDSENVI